MKQQKVLRRRWLMSIVVASFLLSGCATGATQATAPSRMEDLLVQAGFKAVPESNSLCLQICQKLPPDQLVPEKRGTQTCYAYHSSESRLLYMGNAAAYQRFIDLAVVHQVEEPQRQVTTPRSDPEFWTLWQDMQGGG